MLTHEMCSTARYFERIKWVTYPQNLTKRQKMNKKCILQNSIKACSLCNCNWGPYKNITL